MIRILIALSLVILTTPALAMNVTEMKVVSKKNGWELRRGVDDFTDKVSCVVLHDGDPVVQVTNDKFFIAGGRGNGGLRGYQLRIDSKEPQQLQLATDMEKEMGTIIISGTKYREIIGSKRLRVLAIGILSGTGFQKDVPLEGLSDALADWGSKGCPIN